MLRRYQMKRLYTFFMLLSSVLAIGKIMLFGAFLSPAEFGSYSVFLLLSTLTLFSCGFGVDVSLLRYCSRAISRKNERALLTSFSSGIFLIFMLIPIFFAVGGLLYLIFSFTNKYDPSIAIYATICGWFQLMSNSLQARVRAESKLVFFSCLLCLRNILVFGLGGMTIKNNYHILPLIEIISYFIVIVCCSFFGKLNFSKFKIKQIFIHIQMGFPITLSYLLRFGNKSISDVIIILYTPARIYGLFALMTVNYNVILTLINIVSQSVLPEWMRFHTTCKRNDLLYKEIIGFSMKWFFLSVLSCAFLCSLYMFGVKVYYPKYLEIYWVLPIYYLGLLFVLLNQIENYFIIVGKPTQYLLLSIIVIICSFIINFFAVLISPTLLSLTLAFTFIRILAFGISIARARKDSDYSQPSLVVTRI